MIKQIIIANITTTHHFNTNYYYYYLGWCCCWFPDFQFKRGTRAQPREDVPRSGTFITGLKNLLSDIVITINRWIPWTAPLSKLTTPTNGGLSCRLETTWTRWTGTICGTKHKWSPATRRTLPSASWGGLQDGTQSFCDHLRAYHKGTRRSPTGGKLWS